MVKQVDYAAFASHILATRTGVGMKPPFYAETASVKGDPNFPDWIVRNAACNSLGMLMPREVAEALANAMNIAATTDKAQG